MKKIIPLFVLFIFFGGHLLQAKMPEKTLLEFRVSYFHPTSSEFRELFHDGGADYQLIGTLPFFRELNIWTGVNYFSKESRSSELYDKMRIRIIPVTLGLKYFFQHLIKISLSISMPPEA